MRGLVQAAKPLPSRAHSKLLAGLFDVKLKVAFVRLVTASGLSVSATTGLTVSISHGYGAVGSLTFPPASTASATTVWVPSARPTYVCGLEQARKLPPSSWHLYPTRASGSEKANCPSLAPLGCGGPETIVGCGGGFVSIDQV